MRPVVHVTTYPPEHCGIARDLARVLAHSHGPRPIIILGNQVPGAPKRDGAILRVWRKGDLAYPIRIATAFRRTIGDRRTIALVQHHFFLYGGLPTIGEFPVLLALLRLQGSTIVVRLHGIVVPSIVGSELAEVAPPISPALIRWGLKRFYRCLGRTADVLIVQTDDMKRALVDSYGVPASQVEVVRLAWDVSAPPPPATAKRSLGLDHDFLVVFHGFLDPTKGLEDLLRAFAGVRQHIPHARLLIVGEESPTLPAHQRGYTRYLESMATQLLIRDRTTFTGYVEPDRLNTYLAAADVIVLPYSTQSVISGSSVLGVVATFGRPLVVSRTSRFTQELVDGETALIVPPANPSRLQEAIERLANDPRLAAKLGARVQGLARERSSEVIAEHLEHILSKLDGVDP